MDAAAVRLHSGKDQNPNKPWSVPYRGLSPIVVCPLLLAHAGQADQQAGEGTGCNQHPIHRLPICRQQAAPSEVVEHLRHARVQRLGRRIHGQLGFQGRFIG